MELLEQERDGKPVYVHRLVNVCDELGVHSHSYPHDSWVESGEADFELWADGNFNTLLERREGMKPGDGKLHVPAGIFHRWKAKSPGTVIICTDPNGKRLKFASEDNNGR